MERSEMPRKGAYKIDPKDPDMVRYENHVKKGLTFVFCQSGVELVHLAACIKHACYTNVSIINKAMQHAFIDVWDNLFLYDLYSAYNLLGNQDDYPPFMRRSPETDANMKVYHITHLIHHHGHGICLIDGASQPKFHDLIRIIAEHSHSIIRVAFISNPDEDEIERKNQHLLYRQWYELGDIVLPMKDLYDNLHGSLVKLFPQHWPDKKILEEIEKVYGTV